MDGRFTRRQLIKGGLAVAAAAPLFGAGIECVNHSPMIYAYKEKNIALTGSGTLDAGSTSSWNKGSDRAYLESLVSKGVAPEKRIVPGSGHPMRSTFVEPYLSETVLIQG